MASNRIPTLDGWRGIAILLVLFDHLQFGLGKEIFPTGLHGVTLFFVLSGYLITSRLREEFEQTGSIDLRAFYIGRFFRLMPAAWLYLFVMGVVAHGSSVAIRAKPLVACLLFYRNFLDPGPNSFISGHFWSLSIEEQFYLFWPSCLLLLGFRRSRYIAVLAAVAIAAWRLFNWSALMRLEPAATFGTQFRSDSLFVGCAIALSLPLLARFMRAWMLAPLAAILAFYLRDWLLIPLAESIIIGLMLYLTSTLNTPINKFLEWGPLTYIGAISYSLYLWQQPFLCTPIRGSLSIRLLGVLLCAVLSHYFLEQPLIQFGKRLRRHHEYS